MLGAVENLLYRNIQTQHLFVKEAKIIDHADDVDDNENLKITTRWLLKSRSESLSDPLLILKHMKSNWLSEN